MMMVKKLKWIKKGDVLLLLALLLLGGGWLLFQMRGDDNLKAVIYQNGTAAETIDLSRVTEPYTIPLTSTPSAALRVEQGRIRYESASCPDHLCVNAGWLIHPGDTAACLPGRTMVVITTGRDDLVMTY